MPGYGDSGDFYQAYQRACRERITTNVVNPGEAPMEHVNIVRQLYAQAFGDGMAGMVAVSGSPEPSARAQRVAASRVPPPAPRPFAVGDEVEMVGYSWHSAHGTTGVIKELHRGPGGPNACDMGCCVVAFPSNGGVHCRPEGLSLVSAAPQPATAAQRHSYNFQKAVAEYKPRCAPPPAPAPVSPLCDGRFKRELLAPRSNPTPAAHERAALTVARFMTIHGAAPAALIRTRRDFGGTYLWCAVCKDEVGRGRTTLLHRAGCDVAPLVGAGRRTR